MSQNLANLQKALAVEYVLTREQVSRYHDLDELETPTLKVFHQFVAATRQSNKYRQVDFVTLRGNRKAETERASTLRHYAGIADMRQQLNAPIEEWRLVARKVGRGEREPDSFWGKGIPPEKARDKDTVAIEFDAGSYSTKQIKQKLMSFVNYGGQVWGSSSPKRVKTIEKLAKELEIPDFEVLEVRWF